MSNTVFTFYKNEPIPPTTFNASISLVSPLLTYPALPSGLTLTKTASNQFTLAGTPVTQLPTSNYQIVGQGSNSDTGKIVTTINSITVNAERIQFNLSGSPIVDHMAIDAPISQRSLYASFPLAVSGNLRYTWDPLPSGIYFGNFAGLSQASGFTPLLDASYTLTLQGTPTLGAAKSFAAAGLSNYTVYVKALRLTAPNISNSTFYTFQFDPTVLFDDVSIPPYYLNSPLPPNETYFSAKTYFGSDASISTIFSPDLRSDLSLSFISNMARAYLFGTPSNTASTATYTIRASNTLGVTRDTTATISVLNSNVSFDYSETPAIDTCYNFILSRPVSLRKPGYYPSAVQFKVTTLPSNLPVTVSAPVLAGTGIVISNVSSNTFRLSGVPSAVTPLTTITVTASSLDNMATASTTIKLAVLDDSIAFADISASAFNFVQNREITPIQVQATAVLSERPITGYSASGLPTGLGISPGGLITGTPLSDTSGTAIVTATTGYKSGSNSYPFVLVPDTIVFFVNPTSYSYAPGANVSIPVQAVAYSGTSVGNYGFSNFTESYGLSINSGTGLISGTLGDGVPPNPLLPASSNFFVQATAGPLTGSLPANLSTTNPIVKRAYTFDHIAGSSTLYTCDVSSLTPWQPTTLYGGWFSDLQVKNTSLDSNTFILCDSGGSGGQSKVWRSTNGIDFTSINFGDEFNVNSAYKAVNVSNSSTWYIGGTKVYAGNVTGAVFQSIDDGVSWNLLSVVSNLVPRQTSLIGSYYTTKGMAFGYAPNGYLMIGGGYDVAATRVMARSTDGGNTWGSVTKTLTKEVGNFSLDGPVWVATGSSEYSSGGGSIGFPNSAITLNWSANDGKDWSNATGSTFDAVGFEVAYVSNTWLSSGLSRVGTTSVQTGLICSTNGTAWSNVTLPVSFTVFDDMHLPEISSIWFDGSNWNVMVKLEDDVGSNFDCTIYTHDLSSSLTSGWTQVGTGSIAPFTSNEYANTQILSTFKQQYVRTGAPTTVTLTLSDVTVSGPVFTSPTSTSFIENQYITIDPIQLSATGTGQIYFFVENAFLPQGLVFDPLTNQIRGVPVRLGNVTTPVYAKDDNGVTQINLHFTVILPRVVRVQSNASAYTSLLRQYTVVNAAQNARDNRVFPAGDRLLGEFTAPYPPDVTTQKVNPNCFNPECK